MSLSREEKFHREALGYTRAFFIFLDRQYGIGFKEEERRDIVLRSYRDTANHINKHKIFQRTFDGLKLTSFLAYHAARHVACTRSHGGTHDPALVACRAGIHRLSDLLKLETSSEIDLGPGYQGYLMSMLYAEVSGECDAGIGANGLSTVFSFLHKIRPDEDRLKKI